MKDTCTHLDKIQEVTPSARGCEGVFRFVVDLAENFGKMRGIAHRIAEGFKGDPFDDQNSQNHKSVSVTFKIPQETALSSNYQKDAAVVFGNH